MLGFSYLYTWHITKRADLSGISNTGTKLEKAVHKAFVAVDEEGTEAAAATGFAVFTKSAKRRPPVFIVDHSFYFAIVHKTTSNLVLFNGAVNTISRA
uniref:Serpin domain-containing protein n=1 Tax=Strigamia maritima TaxID=126957 RepID=T1JMS4_STRMM